jgi:hypothetical protein
MTIAPTADGIPDDHKVLFDPLPLPPARANAPADLMAMARPITPIENARSSRRASSRSRRAVSTEPAAEHHALYRLYNADGVLLYIGETNNPVERYIEHRDTKEWWPEVTRHSIEWSQKGRTEVQEAEKAAIRDEWPLHNIAHQPRGDGTYFVPSYVVGKILDVVKRATCEIIGDATEEQADAIAHAVFGAFTPRDDEETGVCGYGEIGFPFGGGLRTEPLDLDAVLDAMGPFRPDIDNSMRDPKPQKRSSMHCQAPTGDGRRQPKCGAKLRRSGVCPHPDRHAEDAASMTDPLDAVDGA